MGIGVVVHGIITVTGYGGQIESQRVYRHNRAVIRALPESDETAWPWITRSMFVVLPLRNNYELRFPQYEEQVIAFGASYKNMYLLDAGWIRKFERLLRCLVWEKAVVYNRFANIRYEWEVPHDQHSKSFLSNPPSPPTSWIFRCIGFECHDVKSSEAIDGEL